MAGAPSSPSREGNFATHVLHFYECSVCGTELFTMREVREHSRLGVGMCVACHERFMDCRPIQNEKHCGWCGQHGGRIHQCDVCPESFCEPCIIRNVGSQYVYTVPWDRPRKCFFCDPEVLKAPIAYYRTFKAAILHISMDNIANQAWPERQEIDIDDGPAMEDAGDDEDGAGDVGGRRPE